MPKEVSHRPSSSISTTAAAGGASRAATTWTTKDDETLMSARASGLNWQPIATKHFPSKTANACRKRHERLMERKNAEDWDGVKLETLAMEYMNVRREMWTILANRVGEKWTMVEAKCMEKGLKNLQQAHRSAQRKERGNSVGDSGIGCSDAEHELDEGHSHTSELSDGSQHHGHVQQGGYALPGQRGGPSIQSMLSLSPAYPQPPQ
ncbi:uncharacterized protein BDZ99DRAFT_458553 [Mytilinidion resinicola]|uniref:Myb-like domain-containing protein n=1 Tax=Mytilinidion resinicola TaxID=574789 RepID=A0A6A6Z154_9PEZI|nr:uncharacterized protein BDZ99DRAFT_458553 [Mytilinidion resinicola]KAF2814528.1 hypothetical protein BDZ99DRAFT_458553 [Mytilinidion resinicola]